MTEFRRAASILASALACLALAGCGPHGPKGDRGLAPAPETLATPSLSTTPPDAHRPLKSKAEQEKLKADLLAQKRPGR